MPYLPDETSTSFGVPDPPRDGRTFAWAVGVLFLAGVALRVAMAFEPFWLDEAWSYFLAGEVERPWQLLTEIRHDNNHLLNTLYLFAVRDLVGDEGHWIWFRLLSLLAGAGSLVLVYAIARRWGRTEALMALALIGASYPLVAVSAQARGYGLSVCFALLYYWLSIRHLENHAADPRPWRSGWGSALGLWTIAILGFLAHATFVYTFAAVAIATTFQWLDRGRSWRGTILEQLRCHLVPFSFLVWLYLVFYRGQEVGGGPETERLLVVRNALAQLLALRPRGTIGWIACASAVLLAATGVGMLVRRGDRSWIFFVCVLLLVPASVIAVSDPKVFYPRYLLGCFPWFYLLAALLLAAAWRQNLGARAIAILFLGTVVVMNVVKDVSVLSVGRNTYSRAVAFMEERTRGPVINVGSDHDFRNSTVLFFHARGLSSGKRVSYHREGQWPPGGPRWYIRSDWLAGRNPEEQFAPVPGLSYRLAESFEFGPGPGFGWHLYLRDRGR